MILAPTRIYVKPVLELIASVDVKGLAHITGGGLLENVPRILPDALTAQLDRGPGRARRCSTGCRPKAAWRMKRCIACSTAASA